MKLSVITINFNNSSGLEKTINSVVNQTYDDLEYIIVDGNSSDGSKSVLLEHNAQINHWISEEDGGIYNAMNKGVKLSHGEYCIFINSGDILYDRTSIDCAMKLCPNTDIFVGTVLSMDGSKQISPPSSREISLYHLFSCAIPHQGAFIKRQLLVDYPYDENLQIASDWKFFVKTIVLDNRSFEYINAIICYYDLNGISSKNQILMRQEKENVLTDLFPPRVLSDYYYAKRHECLTQKLCLELKSHYLADKIMFYFGKILINMIHVVKFANLKKNKK